MTNIDSKGKYEHNMLIKMDEVVLREQANLWQSEKRSYRIDFIVSKEQP